MPDTLLAHSASSEEGADVPEEGASPNSPDSPSTGSHMTTTQGHTHQRAPLQAYSLNDSKTPPSHTNKGGHHSLLRERWVAFNKAKLQEIFEATLCEMTSESNKRAKSATSSVSQLTEHKRDSSSSALDSPDKKLDIIFSESQKNCKGAQQSQSGGVKGQEGQRSDGEEKENEHGQKATLPIDPAEPGVSSGGEGSFIVSAVGEGSSVVSREGVRVNTPVTPPSPQGDSATDPCDTPDPKPSPRSDTPCSATGSSSAENPICQQDEQEAESVPSDPCCCVGHGPGTLTAAEDHSSDSSSSSSSSRQQCSQCTQQPATCTAQSSPPHRATTPPSPGGAYPHSAIVPARGTQDPQQGPALKAACPGGGRCPQGPNQEMVQWEKGSESGESRGSGVSVMDEDRQGPNGPSHVTRGVKDEGAPHQRKSPRSAKTPKCTDPGLPDSTAAKTPNVTSPSDKVEIKPKDPKVCSSSTGNKDSVSKGHGKSATGSGRNSGNGKVSSSSGSTSSGGGMRRKVNATSGREKVGGTGRKGSFQDEETSETAHRGRECWVALNKTMVYDILDMAMSESEVPTQNASLRRHSEDNAAYREVPADSASNSSVPETSQVLNLSCSAKTSGVSDESRSPDCVTPVPVSKSAGHSELISLLGDDDPTPPPTLPRPCLNSGGGNPSGAGSPGKRKVTSGQKKSGHSTGPPPPKRHKAGVPHPPGPMDQSVPNSGTDVPGMKGSRGVVLRTLRTLLRTNSTSQPPSQLPVRGDSPSSPRQRESLEGSRAEEVVGSHVQVCDKVKESTQPPPPQQQQQQHQQGIDLRQPQLRSKNKTTAANTALHSTAASAANSKCNQNTAARVTGCNSCTQTAPNDPGAKRMLLGAENPAEATSEIHVPSMTSPLENISSSDTASKPRRAKRKVRSTSHESPKHGWVALSKADVHTIVDSVMTSMFLEDHGHESHDIGHHPIVGHPHDEPNDNVDHHDDNDDDDDDDDDNDSVNDKSVSSDNVILSHHHIDNISTVQDRNVHHHTQGIKPPQVSANFNNNNTPSAFLTTMDKADASRFTSNIGPSAVAPPIGQRRVSFACIEQLAQGSPPGSPDSFHPDHPVFGQSPNCHRPFKWKSNMMRRAQGQEVGDATEQELDEEENTSL